MNWPLLALAGGYLIVAPVLAVLIGRFCGLADRQRERGGGHR